MGVVPVQVPLLTLSLFLFLALPVIFGRAVLTGLDAVGVVVGVGVTGPTVVIGVVTGVGVGMGGTGCAVTWMVALAVLFIGEGSPAPVTTPAALTRAVLLAVTVLSWSPLPDVAVMRVIVAVLPALRVPMEQFTVAPRAQLPIVDTADTTVCPTGRGSLSAVSGAGSGPLLVTLMV